MGARKTVPNENVKLSGGLIWPQIANDSVQLIGDCIARCIRNSLHYRHICDYTRETCLIPKGENRSALSNY